MGARRRASGLETGVVLMTDIKEIKLTEAQCLVIKARIASGIEYQSLVWACEGYEGFKDNPARWLALLQGRYWHYMRLYETAPRRSSNQILPKLRSKHDTLSEGETEIFCESRDERFDETEDDVAALLYTTWHANKWDTVVRRARWDSDVYGLGNVEVGWRWQRGDERLIGARGEPVVAPDAVAIMAGQTMLPPGAEIYETEAQAEAAAKHAQHEEDQQVWGKPVADDPFIDRFCPRDLIVDPNCTSPDLHDARFAFRRRYEYTSRVKADKLYDNTKELQGTVYSVRDTERDIVTSGTASVKTDQAMNRLFDGYVWFDVDDDGIEEFLHIVMCDEHDKPLLAKECEYLDENGNPAFLSFSVNPFPFRIIPGMENDNDSFYPDSPIEQVADLQLAYDESWDTLNEMRRKSTRQYLYPKDSIDQKMIERIERGVDGALIPVDAPLKDQIVPFPHQPIPTDLYASLQSIPIEIGRQLGVSEFSEAITPQKDMTATESLALQQMGGARTSGDARRYREFREDLLMCTLVLLQIFGDRSRAYQHNTEGGHKAWGSMRNTELRGIDDKAELLPVGTQYAIKVNASSSQPKNKIIDQKLKIELLSVLEKFAQMPDPVTGQPIVNIKAALRMVAKTFEEHRVNALVPPDPTPEEVQRIQQAKQVQEQEMLVATQAQQEGQVAREDAQAQRETALKLIEIQQKNKL